MRIPRTRLVLGSSHTLGKTQQRRAESWWYNLKREIDIKWQVLRFGTLPIMKPGAAYDFNEPLLETLLATPPFDSGDVVLAMAFLSPGRHAGEGGDIAQIVEAATAARPDLRVHITPLLATQSLVAAVLRDRVEAAAAAPPLQVE